jgi:carbonic anhydrase
MLQRFLIRLSLLSLLFLTLFMPLTWAENKPEPVLSPQAAFKKMQEGNRRFFNDKCAHPHQSHERLLQLAKEQHPFAVVLTCSDSRLAPELIFDQGLGDIFDVRVAGNVADVGVVGSIEFAVDHLQVPLLVVLGHQRCGAVEAALKHQHPHNHVNFIIHSIAPAIKGHEGGSEADMEAAVKANVQRVLSQLAHDPALEEKLRSGQLKMVGAYYKLDTGEVEWLAPEKTVSTQAAKHK